jgi:hypothetical protein
MYAVRPTKDISTANEALYTYSYLHDPNLLTLDKPNDLNVNQTTECAAQCVQGNGSEEETSSYAACQQSCISSLFFPLSATAGGAGATGTAGSDASDATATGEASGTGIGMSSYSVGCQ